MPLRYRQDSVTTTAVMLLLTAGALAMPDTPVTSDANGQAQPFDRLYGDLTAPDAGRRSEAWETLSRDRDIAIHVLLRLAASEHSSPSTARLRREAILKLGEFRADAGATLVARYLALRIPPDYDSEPSPLDDYPAADAAVRIGEPAVRAILFQRLQHPATDEELRIAAYVLWDHYAASDEQEVGAFRLSRLLEAERSKRESGGRQVESTREGNLRRLVELYRKIWPHDPADWPKP